LKFKHTFNVRLVDLTAWWR